MINGCLSLTQLHYKAVLVITIFCFGLPIAQAKDKDLIIFYSSSTADNISELLAQQIPMLSEFKHIKRVDIEDFSIAQLEKILAHSQQCTITIGEKSLKTILSTRPKKRIYSLKVAKYQLDKLIYLYSRFAVELSGIYQEQSFERQLNLVQAIQPQAKNIAIALGLKTRYWLERYQIISQKHSLPLFYNLLNRQSSLQLFVERIKADHSFLLVANDPDIYSPIQLQSILVTSYNRQIPIIGNKFSDSENAAMVSVYTPTDLLISEVSQQLDHFCSNAQLATAQFSQNYRVTINPTIAESLNYSSLNAESLKMKLQAMEIRLKDTQ